jgi:hypothetical protein
MSRVEYHKHFKKPLSPLHAAGLIQTTPTTGYKMHESWGETGTEVACPRQTGILNSSLYKSNFIILQL